MRILIALVFGMTLAGFGSIAWANPGDVSAPPTLTIPFDEETETAVQAEVTRQVLTFM